MGRTIQDLQENMLMSEAHRWMWFYAQYPFDDYHIHHRPAALVGQMAGGGDMEQKLKFLQDRTPPVPSGYDAAFVNTFKAFGLPLPGAE
jgi:hypothetical protein